MLFAHFLTPFIFFSHYSYFHQYAIKVHFDWRYRYAAGNNCKTFFACTTHEYCTSWSEEALPSPRLSDTSQSI